MKILSSSPTRSSSSGGGSSRAKRETPKKQLVGDGDGDDEKPLDDAFLWLEDDR